jgi:hypothetical protein
MEWKNRAISYPEALNFHRQAGKPHPPFRMHDQGTPCHGVVGSSEGEPFHLQWRHHSAWMACESDKKSNPSSPDRPKIAVATTAVDTLMQDIFNTSALQDAFGAFTGTQVPRHIRLLREWLGLAADQVPG